MELEDKAAFHSGEAWGKNMLSAEVGEGRRATSAKLMALTARVSDDSIRNAVQAIRLSYGDYDLSETPQQATAVSRSVSEAYIPLMEEIGRALRELY